MNEKMMAQLDKAVLQLDDISMLSSVAVQAAIFTIATQREEIDGLMRLIRLARSLDEILSKGFRKELDEAIAKHTAPEVEENN